MSHEPSSATPPSSTTHRVGIALTMADIDHYEKTGEYPSAMNAWAFRYAISEMARVAFARSETVENATEGRLCEALRPAVSNIFNNLDSLSRGQALQILVDALRDFESVAHDAKPDFGAALEAARSAIASHQSVWEVENKTTRILFSTKESAQSFINTFPASVAGGMQLRQVGVV